MTQSPNILFILTDQQTLKAMSCAANLPIRTPNMDRLAAGGMRFEHSLCASPVCGPSRASIVTGLPSHQHGLIHHGSKRFCNAEDGRLPTVADKLRDVGYGAYWVGKWHAEEFYPNRAERIHGFDFLPVAFDGFHGLGLDTDRAVTDRAIDFLKYPPSESWFLGVSWHNPHDICYWIMEKYREKLDPVTGIGELPPLPYHFEVSPDEPDFITQSRLRKRYGPEMQWTSDWTDADWRKYLRAYYRLVEHVDVELGRLLDALDASAAARDTVVVFTSDHGEGCAAHRLVVKLTPYDEAIAVPLLFFWPEKIPAGSLCRTHVASGLDLFPTFCSLGGAMSQDSSRPGIDLLPFLKNPDLPGRDYAVVEVDPDPQNPDFSARVVRSKTHKYMAFSHGHPSEALYDLRKDPGETRNLLGNPDLKPALAKLRKHLQHWCEATADSFSLPQATS